MIAFGIGSLYFDRKDLKDLPDRFANFDDKKHYKILQDSLESIPNISDIEIQIPQTTSIGTFSGSYAHGDNEHDLFPFICKLVIKFTINIPDRIQQNISIPRSCAGSEIFNVVMQYEFDSPVTFIWYKCESTDARPSDAVVIVRKHLEKYFDSNDSKLSFNTLGPSPFHADFYITESKQPNADNSPLHIEDESLPGVGYKDFRIVFNPNDIKDELDALAFFSDIYSESISVFYKTVLYRNDLLHLSFNAQHNLTELINQQNKGGVKGILSRLLSAPKINRDLMISLMKGEIVKTELNSYVSSSERDQSLIKNSLFKNFVDRERSDISFMPASDVKDVIKLFEDRYLKNIENATVLIAGLVGGIVGSLITMLISK